MRVQLRLNDGRAMTLCGTANSTSSARSTSAAFSGVIVPAVTG
jgi:hypothetical protein